ncbi:O-antigen ligase family protein [Granulicella sibirica]|uniref:O-antigen ligase-related domain-containing protein n=1 Tax=Granulicella sibirica TaxID=2479048 RepID=A0A4Q0SYC9_9BACT|nr:O-antigen ligase family protein [Granulicella sibirica]RXH54191.1 hypothetical protein GRAN_4842 [Granulicella sibirica]
MAETSQPASGTAKTIGFFLGFRMIVLVVGTRAFGLDPQLSIGLTLGLNFLCLVFAAMGRTDDAGARNLLRLGPIRWAVLFLAFTGTSLSWTVAVSPSAALVYWCAMVADACMVTLVLRQGPPRQQGISIMQGFIAGACCVAVVAWLLPEQSDLRLGDEELLGPNQIGFLCAFALFFTLFLIRERAGRYKPAAAFLAMTLLRSLSKTSILACLAALSWLLVRDRSLHRNTKVALTLLVVAVFLLFSPLLSAYIDVYSNLGNQSITLSGRLSIWAYVLNEALDLPWTGHGFHSMWKVIPPMNGDFEPRHAHNEILQQFYAYGVAGLGLLVGIYSSFYRQIRKLNNPSMKAFLSALLLFILIRGLTDTEVFDLSLPMWAVILWSVLMRGTDEQFDARTPVSPSFQLSEARIVTG